MINGTKYDRVDDMWSDIISELLTNGKQTATRVGESAETIGYSATLKSLDYTFVMNPRRKASPQYAAAELLWYLSGRPDVDMLVPYAPSYSGFCEGNVAWGAYGNRWMNDPNFVRENQGGGQSQITKVIELLNAKPESRQAIVTMWNAGDIVHAVIGAHKDLPCTIAWQFLKREGKLHMVCTMRSNDSWLGFPYDVFVNTTVQRLIAMATNSLPGTYTHQVGSMHLYDKNREQAIEAMMPRNAWDAELKGRKYTNARWTGCGKFDFEGQVQTALRLEAGFREGCTSGIEGIEELHPVLADHVTLCAMKFIQLHPDFIKNEALREAYQCIR